jgi:DNA-binding NarL/FixJ family response regulator
MARHYSIILADDQIFFRERLRANIEEEVGLKVIGEVGSGTQLLEFLQKSTPDMVILDISLPSMRGVEVSRSIKRYYPQVKVLFLTMYNDPEYLKHALASGAEGFLLKEDAGAELASAIDQIRHGGIYISAGAVP